ncbi:MAG: S41 family peptidase [Pedobacter sp.]|uniref:S41 family peptidase n=1 Tax=Pedobacter sp. TaxID=1411316 RepID=UPI0035677515
MKRIFWFGKSNFLIAMVLIMALGACKKSKVTPEPDPVDPTVESNTKQIPTTNRRELTNDSLFLYAKQIYFWNTTLPSYDVFEPRKYQSGSSYLAIYENTLWNIGKVTGSPDYIEGKNWLKYSYISDSDLDNPQASAPLVKSNVDLEGNGMDIGIRPVSYLTTNSEAGPYYLFVTAVYPGSPAAIVGMKRGYMIQKINGVSVGTSFNSSSEVAARNQINGSSAVRLQGVISSGGVNIGPFDITLTPGSYKSNPVYITKTITAGTKKIGYINFARFSNLKNNAQSALDDAFSTFVANGVKDLIVDLRYNGGGYINTAEYLINLIAPANLTGSVMFREYYNATMQGGRASILKNQPLLDDNNLPQYEAGKLVTYADIVYTPEIQTTRFAKRGSLTGVTSVIFIVSGNTASASELVINSLKAYMNVKVVGEKTYGKPIGFFPIRLENRYDVYFSMFETKNAKGEGGYFNGMIPDYAENNVEEDFWDNPFYDFGDVNEGYLAKAISVVPGVGIPVTTSSKAAKMIINGRDINLSKINIIKPVKPNDEFLGMIEDRLKRK